MLVEHQALVAVVSTLSSSYLIRKLFKAELREVGQVVQIENNK